MTAGLVRHWLESGRLELPLPASGRTAERWQTHALVTGRIDNGQRGLFAVTITDPAVKPLPSTWWNAGMAGSDTRSVQFTNAHAVAVGDPGD